MEGWELTRILAQGSRAARLQGHCSCGRLELGHMKGTPWMCLQVWLEESTWAERRARVSVFRLGMHAEFEEQQGGP